MICPECGYKTQVLESRERDGHVQRRRACGKCGIRFNTTEVKVDSANAFDAPPTAAALAGQRHNRIVQGHEAGRSAAELAVQEKCSTSVVYKALRIHKARESNLELF